MVIITCKSNKCLNIWWIQDPRLLLSTHFWVFDRYFSLGHEIRPNSVRPQNLLDILQKCARLKSTFCTGRTLLRLQMVNDLKAPQTGEAKGHYEVFGLVLRLKLKPYMISCSNKCFWLQLATETLFLWKSCALQELDRFFPRFNR